MKEGRGSAGGDANFGASTEEEGTTPDRAATHPHLHRAVSSILGTVRCPRVLVVAMRQCLGVFLSD